MSDTFTFLPVPEELFAARDGQGNLPLEYVNADWSVLVCTGQNPPEYAFTTGRSLHKHWESSSISHFGAHSSMPLGTDPIVCPNGKRIAIKILDYEFSAGLEKLDRRKAPTRTSKKLKLKTTAHV